MTDAANYHHCCEEMRKRVEYVCEEHRSSFECPDSLIYFSKSFEEYGLIIHDGGNSFITISFCPFCGTKLPESKRK